MGQLPTDTNSSPNYTAAQHATHHNSLATLNNILDSQGVLAPTSPNAANYEFNATTSSLPSGWSWVNQGAAPYTEGSGWGTIDCPATTGDNFRCLVEAVPAGTSWTLTVRMTYASATAAYYGTLLRESSSGKILATFHRYDSVFGVLNATNAQAVSGTVATATVYIPLGLITYHRIKKNSATSYDFAISPNGTAWWTVLAGHNPSGTLTPDQIGWFGQTANSIAASVAIDWFRVT